LIEAKHILERVTHAGETARAVAGGLRGRLDIGFTGSMIYRDVPRIVNAFGERMPGIELTLCEMSSSEQIEALLHGQLHAGFANAATVPKQLVALPLPDDTLVCCLPDGHPLAEVEALNLVQLADERFVMFSRDVAPANHDNVIATFSRAGIHPRTCHAARQWLTVVALVANGVGVALVPASIARCGITGARFIPLRGPVAHSVGVLAWDGTQGTPALDAFIETARSLLHRV
jgi:DNA-binding transcriptional LysR family regulator